MCWSFLLSYALLVMDSVTVLQELAGSKLKIFLSILSVWMQEVDTVFSWSVIVSWLSITIQRFFAWFAGWGVVQSSAGQQVKIQSEVSLPKITTSDLSVLSLRQLVFIHLATSDMQAEKLVWVFGVLLERESISRVSPA